MPAQSYHRRRLMAESSIAHELAKIAELACDKLTQHFQQMPDEDFFREFDGLEDSNLFKDIPTDLEWLSARFESIRCNR